MTKNNSAKALEPASEQSSAPRSENAAPAFPIVGIGASAGGLAAFDAFFSALPADVDSGMAFVLVQHLAPDHESLLSELVRRYTRMQVLDVVDGIRVEPNRAYIIPPNCDMGFVDGTLRLHAPAAPRGRRLPIDFFFRSLAEDQRERAICIVLSGSGSDGTLGLRAIKGEGGMAMAQNPQSTEFDGMPRSAIATGLVDYVLPPAEMPAQLIAYAASSFGSRRPSSHPANAEVAIGKVFVLLRTRTGHDFSHYKQSTIRRRIERRMAVHQISELSGYVLHLADAPTEVDALFRDLLIGVTSFFRDPDAFAALDQHVLARLVADKPNDAVIRVWVAGCSTGEEAFSIAMLLRERLDASKKSCRVQIFATDIDPRAIDVARAGIYLASVAADLTPERLAAHFLAQEDGSWRVTKGIRDMLVFSEQDLARDPPFSRLDLISCRNLLIYMGPKLQKRLIPLFHYALSPAGALFLGTSETVGEFSNLFSTTERKEKIYQRRQDVHDAARPLFGSVRPPTELGEARASARKAFVGREPTSREVPFRELAERSLLEESPAGAVIDEHGELLYLHGHTGQYLQPATQEKMQTSNEELESSNEELQSTNEELQSTNEELETSKEELQSVNEELATVNAELQSNVSDLSRSNNDLNNLLAGTGIGTVFVDHQLHIRRFTPAITQFINLIPTDVGRPLGHTVSNLVGYDRLVADVQAVLDTLVPGKVDVKTRAGAAYLLRIQPYRTAENVIEGAVLTFTERAVQRDAPAERSPQSLAAELVNGTGAVCAVATTERGEAR